MTTLEINALIQPLEQYVTPDQKSELEKILSIGKKWKAEGEQKKKEFREKNKRKEFYSGDMDEEEEGVSMPGPDDYTLTEDKFADLLFQYPENKRIRIEKNKEILEFIGYYTMNVVEKYKFEKEFIRDLILYTKNYEYIVLDKREIIKTLEELGQDKQGTNIDLFFQRLGADGAREMSKVLTPTGGIKHGSRLYLGGNKIGPDGAIALSEAMSKTGGLKIGSILYLYDNQIGDEGTIAIAKALAKTGGLKESSELDLGSNDIGDEGAIALAEAISQTGGLKEGSELNLRYNQIGDVGIRALTEAISQTGGLKEGTVLNFIDNQFGYLGEEMLKKLENEAKKLTRCYINFNSHPIVGLHQKLTN